MGCCTTSIAYAHDEGQLPPCLVVVHCSWHNSSATAFPWFGVSVVCEGMPTGIPPHGTFGTGAGVASPAGNCGCRYCCNLRIDDPWTETANRRDKSSLIIVLADGDSSVVGTRIELIGLPFTTRSWSDGLNYREF